MKIFHTEETKTTKGQAWFLWSYLFMVNRYSGSGLLTNNRYQITASNTKAAKVAKVQIPSSHAEPLSGEMIFRTPLPFACQCYQTDNGPVMAVAEGRAVYGRNSAADNKDGLG